MSMTRKHYELIAKAIRREITAGRADRESAMHIGYGLAYFLEEDNPRFNRERFLDACLITSEGE